MLQSFQPTKEDLKEPDTGTDVWYQKDSGKKHFHQLSLWSIMSDRPSYTIHPPDFWSLRKWLHGFLYRQIKSQKSN